MSTYPAVVTSPAMWTWPVVIRVSTATRLFGSCASIASRIESLIWSAILSGWPSVTDSEVKRRRDMSVLLGRGCASAGRTSHDPGGTLPGRDQGLAAAGGSDLRLGRAGQLRHDR